MDNYKNYLSEYNIIPVYKEFYADNLTPVLALKRLKELDNDVFLLESANNSGIKGRYSILGYRPNLQLKIKDNNVKIIAKSEIKEFETDDPILEIEKVLDEYHSPIIEELPPFTGGLVGYISYDFFKYSEPTLKLENDDPFGFDDVNLLEFLNLIVFDHFRDKVVIISNAKTDDFANNYLEALKTIEKIKSELEVIPTSEFKSVVFKEFEPTFTEEQYNEVIKKAKYYIVEGDIFQVVPSNRLKAIHFGSLFPVYRVIRSDNPSPYMYYYQTGNQEIIGTSPETLVKLENNKISTFPIAGSRPRGKTKEEDEALANSLINDQKELAEHKMLVDLGRNDLGKVSKYGTVKVKDYLHINRYSKIMHLTSRVESEKLDDLSPVKILSSVLPAGTLSGAPKIRACQIIEELEKEKRGPYGGAIGYLGFNGNMDMCIAIRSAYKIDNNVFVQSGGGIVIDSNEHNEYLETINKAAAVIEAFNKGEELTNDFNFR